MSRRKKAAAAALDAVDVAGVAAANPFVQRLIDDDELRQNLRRAADSTKRAYDRLSHAKNPAKALIDDRKLQGELRKALEALRDVTNALAEEPKKAARKGRRKGRGLLILAVGGGVAMVASEDLRSKVLDTLFGAEEEFQYSPPPPESADAPTSPVSAA
jgi:hypothetical protein